MKITIAAVISVNGKITKGQSSKLDWSSADDANFLHELIAEHDLIVMGRKTYETVRPKPSKNKLRLVMTRYPKMYTEETITDQLEFVSQSPIELMSKYSRTGYK